MDFQPRVKNVSTPLHQVLQLALLGKYGTKTMLQRAESFRIPR
jgi:hypothetical protein